MARYGSNIAKRLGRPVKWQINDPTTTVVITGWRRHAAVMLSPVVAMTIPSATPAAKKAVKAATPPGMGRVAMSHCSLGDGVLHTGGECGDRCQQRGG